MARPIIWPTASRPVAEPPAPQPPTLLETLDCSSLLASLGPALSSLFSTRISARYAPDPAPATQGKPTPALLAAGRVTMSSDSGPVDLDIAIESAAAAHLVERLFGNHPTDASSAAATTWPSLPPGSGSWVSLCRFLTSAVTSAMAAAGHAPAGPPMLPPRAADHAPPPGTTCLRIELDIGGAHAILLLSDPSTPAPLPAPEPPPPPDARQWRRNAHARTLQLELPVALRLADTRLLLSDVAALRAGDVIPLARPRTLGVLVGGQRLADIPTQSLLPDDPQEPSQ